MSDLEVSAHRTVYADPAHYCGPGPAVVEDPASGRLTVAFRRVPAWIDEGLTGHWHPATESCLTHSDDDGATWSVPQVFSAGCQCPNLRRLDDGTLVHHSHRFELVHEALFERIRAAHPDGVGGLQAHHWPGVQRGAFVQRSSDGGITWSRPAHLRGAPEVEPLHPKLGPPLAVRGNLLETAAGPTPGRLLVSAYRGGQTNTSHLFASDDGGRTWGWVARIAEDANETFLHETTAGELVAFLRCWSDPDRLRTCRSADGGRTWSSLEAVCRGFPACAAPLPSGRVLLVYGYRFEDGRAGAGYGVRARVLNAEARAGDDTAQELILRGDGAVADLGYPDAVARADGSVFVVFYHNAGDQAPAGAPGQAPRTVEACIVREA